MPGALTRTNLFRDAVVAAGMVVLALLAWWWHTISSR